VTAWPGTSLHAQDNAPDTVVLPPRLIHLPAITVNAEPPPPPPACPLTSDRRYETIPIQGTPRNSPYTPDRDPDLNLAVRSYMTSNAARNLINLDGHTDDDAPQLAYLFRPPRVPELLATHRVYDWDWTCPFAAPGLGCRGWLIEKWEVTLVSKGTTPGEAIYPPARRADILNRVYGAMVLYAEEQRLTITYTREDTPAPGYVVHLEDFCVDPNLLALYRSSDAAGRRMLPGLRLGDPVGTARDEVILVAVRDTGEFMDPRSAKDWWQDVVRARRQARE
jgi:hypothetical protein